MSEHSKGGRKAKGSASQRAKAKAETIFQQSRTIRISARQRAKAKAKPIFPQSRQIRISASQRAKAQAKAKRTGILCLMAQTGLLVFHLLLGGMDETGLQETEISAMRRQTKKQTAVAANNRSRGNLGNLCYAMADQEANRRRGCSRQPQSRSQIIRAC